ncbi:unnamed protein product (macronuclear) [Paramecium tetraurelia]|uniref:Uncharacterized protein n=1 Tax=Paramecium tetraurelia TaxID=5888 RepID=A0CVV2_PARTE|nr:uncharacterized protein GSPATT00001121001 [Paramecium tetraurelia]CAK74919.1 unnamed protein product [Paramecium tetraurelia]|eukprot:XP_001442316.1 hypothetical protein (macronuclear) [Paramecium tetraurelia strain d4-2]
MKFDKLHSHNSTPKTVEFASTTKSTFVPPPLGLDIVTMPNNKIFDLFLKGSISAKQMLKMDHNDIDNVPRIAPRRQQTRHKSIKKNQADQIFSLVERFQQQRKQSVIIAQNPKPSHPPKLQRKETLMQLTSSTKELIQPIQQSRFRAPVRKFSQRSTSSGKEEQLIKRCEKLSGERLNVEEKELLLKKDITDEDAWRMMNVFQKKKWFFDYVHRNLDQQSKQQQSQQEIKVQAQPISLFQKLRNTVLKQTEVKRKPEKQCQEYYNHIQNIEDQIKYHVFNRDLPEQIRNQQKPSVKMYRSESEVSKLNIRNKFIEAADKFSINQSNPQVLKDFFENGSQTCRSQPRISKTKLTSRKVQRPQLSRENDISHESQGDSYKSITEFRLNELYHESKLRQKQYKSKYDTPIIDNGDQLQRKVKNLVRLGNLQNTILNVVSFKLQQ